MIERLADLYVAGRITVEELERRLEPALLREAPRGLPVPPGWQPLPPCDHDWLDITVFGSTPYEVCVRCGDERFA